MLRHLPEHTGKFRHQNAKGRISTFSVKPLHASLFPGWRLWFHRNGLEPKRFWCSQRLRREKALGGVRYSLGVSAAARASGTLKSALFPVTKNPFTEFAAISKEIALPAGNVLWQPKF
jgi:hypothetical protein